MLPPGSASSALERRLLKFYRKLTKDDRESLLAFAEFLVERRKGKDETVDEQYPLQPKSIPRPEAESVVAAIRRLSETFYMLERSEILNETSALMSSHVLQGRDAVEVIDDLEALFSRHYDRYISRDN